MFGQDNCRGAINLLFPPNQLFSPPSNPANLPAQPARGYPHGRSHASPFAASARPSCGFAQLILRREGKRKQQREKWDSPESLQVPRCLRSPSDCFGAFFLFTVLNFSSHAILLPGFSGSTQGAKAGTFTTHTPQNCRLLQAKSSSHTINVTELSDLHQSASQVLIKGF